MREKIQLTDTTLDLVTKMSEGNPGALSVLMDMVTSGHTLVILSLDDMNIRGSQIWVGWKDHFFKNWKGEEKPTKEDQMAAFIEAITDRDPAMVETINNECFQPDLPYEGYKEKAVTHGASWEHQA